MSKMMKRFGGMAGGRGSKKGKKNNNQKGRGRTTKPSMADLRQLQQSGPAGLDQLLGVRRENKPWP
jgi:hypothetical protein